MAAFIPMRRALLVVAFALHLTSFAQPVEVYPVRRGDSALSLDGTWQFKYLVGSALGTDADFFQPGFAAASTWKTIPVPAHWELEGFAEPKYGRTLIEGTGLYRRTFRVPAAWQGQRVFLHFDGVLSGFDAFVNGKKVGSWASGYNPVAFDVTDALQPNADNLLAVHVTTRSKGWEFDTNDCWSLSGIYREVTLFAVPATHVRDVTTRTTLAADGHADLAIEVAASAAAIVRGKLTSPNGTIVREFEFPLRESFRGSTTLAVATPTLWNAEQPALYRLDLSLVASGQVVQQLAQKIGLREVTTTDGVLKLNGRPIKLHGADHHDIWPEHGRVATESLMRRDLDLMRAANINFIRTSHYPPHPRFIELCDELGFYVMCEVPFGFGDDHLNDASYQDTLLTRARATITRDKNHPSVIVWSVGNENPITPIQLETGHEVKRLDPTRPICFPTVGSYFGRNYEKFPDFVDVYAPHYPTAGTLRDFAQKLTRPIIVTEYAHALGLATDRVQDLWEIMQSSPRIAGGAVWMFQDQGILRRADARPPADKTDLYVRPDAGHYYDTDTNQGMDGLVYSDRTPQTDYWEVRKVYSPIQIAERTAAIHPGKNELTLHVENRHDFRALTGFTLSWTLRQNTTALQSGTVPLTTPAHESSSLPLVLSLPSAPSPSDVYSLELRCAEGSAPSIYERTLRLDVADAKPRSSELISSTTKPLQFTDSATEVRIQHERFDLRVNRATSVISLLDHSGQPLVAAIGPHTGRKFTEAETLRAKTAPIWTGHLLTSPTDVRIESTPATDGTIRLTVHGRYARPETADQFLDGDLTLVAKPDGTIAIAYDYVPVKGSGTFLEAGLALAVPAAASEFRWLGQGPYAGYPGKDRLNEFGLHHLNREDLNFQGNRREVELALLTRPTGSGIAILTERSDTAVENRGDEIILAHNAVLSGRGNKGSGPDLAVKADDARHISGQFTLVPLANDWPATLTRWFGPATQTVPVLKPFVHSYDQ